MANLKFILSCIVSSVLMFGVSYMWHGIFLNDLSRLSYSINVYFVFAPIAYFGISFILVYVHQLELMSGFSKNLLLQGFLSGLLCGFFIYIISIVVGVSFVKSVTLKNLAIDLPWQMIEQGFGGVIVSIVYVFVPDSSRE